MAFTEHGAVMLASVLNSPVAAASAGAQAHRLPGPFDNLKSQIVTSSRGKRSSSPAPSWLDGWEVTWQHDYL